MSPSLCYLRFCIVVLSSVKEPLALRSSQLCQTVLNLSALTSPSEGQRDFTLLCVHVKSAGTHVWPLGLSR